MSVAYEITSSWRRDGCSELCWQRYVQIERGGRLQILTYHDLDSHRLAWERERQQEPTVTGPLTFDYQRHIVQVDGSDIYLTVTETKIMFALADRIGTLRTTDEMLLAVWGPGYSGERGLWGTHLARLREHLGAAASMVLTHVGKGVELRRLDPCHSADIPSVVLPVLNAREELARNIAIGPRQLAIVQTLQAAPGRRMTVATLLVAIWGNRDTKKSLRILEVSTSALQRRGYQIHLEHARDASLGSIWLDAQ